ncbi:autotransporter domain-containing protein [Burkholderia multivorans]|uniref:autotransporter family protein n=1 Tax=Burkholderia multivorans TaxID=87883 RepID=UPI001C2202EF|nr:autotransporter domain-containing protein [Burkholderia multivorans]MBU9200250.1 autotransporter domain-containing protein [Burkholderia multivorans]
MNNKFRAKPKLTAVAVAAALMSLSALAHATPATCYADASGTYAWSTGDCDIAATPANKQAGAAIVVPNGAVVGLLTVDPQVNVYGSPALDNEGTVGSVDIKGHLMPPDYTVAADAAQNILNNGSMGTVSLDYASMSGAVNAVENNGHIDALNLNGSVFSEETGVKNTGTIGSINIQSVGNIAAVGRQRNDGVGVGILNESTAPRMADIGSISIDYNSVAGQDAGIRNVDGHIGDISISGNGQLKGNYALDNVATNSGAAAVIDTIAVQGQVLGITEAVRTSGTIGELDVKAQAIVDAPTAIHVLPGGAIGNINVLGAIGGNIENESTNALTFNGNTTAMGVSNPGVLMGADSTQAFGSISSANADVNFGQGALALQDNVTVGAGHAVNNVGSTLVINSNPTIHGNFTQAATGTLMFGVGTGAVSASGDVAGDTGYGRLTVTGSAVLAQGSSVGIQMLQGYAPTPGQRFVVVDAAAAGTNYNDQDLHYSVRGYTRGVVVGHTVTEDGRSYLVLDLSQQAAPPTGTTPPATGTPTGGQPGSGGDDNTSDGSGTSPTTPTNVMTSAPVSSLQGLGNYTGIKSADLLNLFNAAIALNANGSYALVKRVGTQLSPAMQSSAAHAAVAPTVDSMGIVSAHVNSLRVASASTSGIATGESAPKNGVWGQAFGGHASQGVIDDVSGYSANYGGFILGADRAVNDQWRAGGAFTYSHSSVNGTEDAAGASTGINAFGFLGYASYNPKNAPWYVNLQAGVVQQHFNSVRSIGFDGFHGVANGSYDGQQYVIGGEFGWPLQVGKYTVTPTAKLMYSYQHQGSYTESGGNGAALSVGATHETSVRTAFGARLERSFTSKWGTVIPSLDVSWIHEYDQTRLATAASYAADPSGQTAFTTLGASPVSDLADIGIGATLVRSNNLSLTARYELQAGSRFVSQTGSLRLRKLF